MEITVDKALIEQALMFADAIDRPNLRGAWHLTGKQLDGLRDELRAAIAEPAVEPDDAPYECPVCGELDPSTSCGSPTCGLIAPPAEVPMLSDEEMRSCAEAMDAEPLAEGWKELIKFARAIEAAVRRKAGL